MDQGGLVGEGSGDLRSIRIGARLDVVQALRFVAATAVLCVHLPAIGRGYWGVDLFFIISGFVMCLSTARSSDRFFLKRIIRVIPLYWVMTFGVFTIAIFAPQLLRSTTADLNHLFKSLIFIPFDKNGMGHYPVLFVGWTLNYEMMFYAVFGIALNIGRFHPAVTAATLMLGIFALARLFAVDFPGIVYADVIILEFSLGMLVYLLYARPESWRLASLIVAATVVVGVLMAKNGLNNRVTTVGISCALSVYIAVKYFGELRLPLFVLLLGDASYSLYLSHAYVIRGLNRSGLLPVGGIWMPVSYLAAFGACLLVAIALWTMLERPMSSYLRRRLIRSRLQGEASPADRSAGGQRQPAVATNASMWKPRAGQEPRDRSSGLGSSPAEDLVIGTH